MATKLQPVFEILDSLDLLPKVFQELSTADALSLAQMSRACRAEFRRLFFNNAKRSIGVFVNDVDSFMDVLNLHCTELSGSVVLSILQREALFDGSDLDLYTPKGAAMCMRNYLEVFEGYTAIKDRHRDASAEEDYQVCYEYLLLLVSIIY